MAAEWRATTIGDLLESSNGELQTGPFGSQLHAHDYDPAGAVVVVPTSAIGRRRLLPDEVQRIPRSKGDELARHYLRAGDIVFARRGLQAAGLSALVAPEQDGWLCGTGGIRLRLPSSAVDTSFLSFVLSTDATYNWIRQHAVGATMPNLNEVVVRGIPVVIPPLDEQRRIAAILGALDDKIELNREMNRTLEEMAQALFKSWFIDFDGHADLVDTEIGPVPRGWRVAGLDAVADNVRDTVHPGDVDAELPYVGLEHVPRRCAALAEWGRAADVDSGKARFAPGDLLFGKLRPYFHKVVPVWFEGVASTDILVVRPQRAEWRWFSFGHLFSDALVAHATAASDGTKMPRTRWSDLCRWKVAIPPIEVAKSFDEIAAPLYRRISANVEESRTLAALRDTLLPKLISGELRVPGAEALVESA